jgi:hypothetical protein
MARIDSPPTIPLDISSRSDSVNANADRFLSVGRMPPVGDNRPNIEDDSRSNTRPIELIDLSLLFVQPYTLFVVYIPSSTLHLYLPKVEVLH